MEQTDNINKEIKDLEDQNNILLSENSITISTANSKQSHLQNLFHILGINGNWAENDFEVFTKKGISYCEYKSNCDETKIQTFQFIDDDGKTHNIQVIGDIYYHKNRFSKNSFKIKLTSDNWDGLVALKKVFIWL